MKNKLMFIGLTTIASVGLNASQGAETIRYGQLTRTEKLAEYCSGKLTSAKSGISSAATYLGNTRVATKTADFGTYLGTTKPVIKAFEFGSSVAAKTASAGKSVYQTTIGGETLGYFKYDRQAATSAAALATVGLTYATYKAYKNGSFSKLNPFGKAAVVAEEIVAPVVVAEEVVATAPVVIAEEVIVTAPVVMKKRAFNTPKVWNAKTRTYEVAK
ncbi:MAG: hypothetical protein WC747_04565 [Candidatus Babeliales bacterium]|jgi:hypothetical protein